MPRKRMDRRTSILKKLQDNIRHKESTITSGRCLAIKRWVKTYLRHIEYLKDDQLKFLSNIISDESCWSGTRLINATLGQKLIEEKIDGIKNPLCTYNMACRYCMINKIPQLFQDQLNSYKASFSNDEELDDDGEPLSLNDKYVRNELLSFMGDEDPAFSFWIDKKSGEFKKHEDAAKSFDEAVKFKWHEGVEYFYNHLSEEDKKKKIVETIVALSSVQSNQNAAAILDFCFHKMTDHEKCDLLKNSELSKKHRGIYSLLQSLIKHGFFDTVQMIISMFEDKVLEDKILSPKHYSLLLSLLSEKIAESPQAKNIMMDLIKSGNFINCEGKEEKAAVFFSNGYVPIERALIELIVDWANDDQSNTAKKNEIFYIFKFAKKFCSAENFENFEKYIIKNLRMVGSTSMKDDICYYKLAEKLFSEFDEKALWEKLPEHLDSKLKINQS